MADPGCLRIKNHQGSHAVEHNKGYRDGYQKGLFDGRNRQIEELKQENKCLTEEL